jgi:Zn-dependent oligopeptidase
MANNPVTVEAFIKDIVEKSTPLWEKERQALLELKKEEVRSMMSS